MNLLASVKAWYRRRQPLPLNEWFFVTFDNERVTLRANPPGRDSWDQSFTWSSITRVCFKDEGPYASDGLYIFTSERAESFVVPTEAHGGDEFFGALAGRGFFPPEVMASAVRSVDGGLYCWPPEQAAAQDG
jgi:hypothetical protein